MEKNVRIFDDVEELSVALAERIVDIIGDAKKRINIAISGGSTPKILFKQLSEAYRERIPWFHFHFFWVDERCVPPDSPESNFKLANDYLFHGIPLRENNIHRIKGEERTNYEVRRYRDEIISHVELENNLPCFDLILLGVGEDGHTGSIFPDQMHLLKSDKICEVAVQPETKQERITLTGPVLNNAKNVIFLVSGKSKAEIIYKVLESKDKEKYPAANIKPLNGGIEWFLDREAAEKVQ